MRTAVLLGNPGTKRSVYFEHAACQAGLHVLFVDWKDWLRSGFPGTETDYFVKIDPPLWDSCHIDELKQMTGTYTSYLTALAGSSAAFLNTPEDLMSLLDKRDCKKRLKAAGLPVTEMFEESPGNLSQLLEAMAVHKINQVFIKPVCGSGAAGVTALRLHPVTGQMSACSCALPEKETNGLINTKQLRFFTQKKEIKPLLDRLLSQDCIVERWYPKAVYQEYSYDLRAVVQDGRLDFLLARLSKGPVTNLHLNNHPLEASRLCLPEAVLTSIKELCLSAMDCYPTLRSAGIDLLLEKQSLKPRIIEMNGQGDLLYQDIYKENTIYLHQAVMMKEWVNQGEYK